MLTAKSRSKTKSTKKAGPKPKRKFVKFSPGTADLNDVVRGGKRYVGPNLLDHMPGTPKPKTVKEVRGRGDHNDVIRDGKPYVGRSILDFKPTKR